MIPQTLTTSNTLKVYDDILQTIGKTPLIRLNRLGRGLPCPIYAKVEFFNPGGSIKDRIALNIIEEAERSGRLKPGGTIVESTSGNTGVGLAIVSAKKGYKTIFVLPDKMSEEKIQLLRAFGAKVVITPTAVAPEDPQSYYSVAKRLVAETPNAILANQYHNPENPRSHYQTTGPEIWEQTGGLVTDVVAGMGTGGTISGVGRYLKEQNPDIRIVGADPVGSLLLETWQQGRVPGDAHPKTYKVEGIGEDFLPSTLDLSLIDQIVRVGDKESFLWARRLVREEGIFAGGSSGSALAAAIHYAQTLPPDRLLVVILPDSGSRYLSDGVTNGRWIDVNLAEQTLAVYDNHQLVFATIVSTGLAPFWTRPGLFPIYKKKALENMSGSFEADRSDYYYLENVPWTMYFDKARALHGTYWHTYFGYPQSHGCVNLSAGDSHWLFNWAKEGDWVYVHDPSGATPTDPAKYGEGGA